MFKIDLACNEYGTYIQFFKKSSSTLPCTLNFLCNFLFLFQMGWRVALASLALLGLAAANDSGLFECPKGEILPSMTLKGPSHV